MVVEGPLGREIPWQKVSERYEEHDDGTWTFTVDFVPPARIYSRVCLMPLPLAGGSKRAERCNRPTVNYDACGFHEPKEWLSKRLAAQETRVK